MRWNRRDFIKLCSASSLAVVGGAPRRAFAQTDDGYDGPLFVMVHAGGGWDPTSVCDPKGRANEEAIAPVNMFFTDEIGTIGNLKYAPIAGVQSFFETYGSQLLVINGIDTETNGHDSGTRNIWSGKLAEGYPSFAALVAGAKDPSLPLSFLSNGGYDITGGLVAPTRVGSAADIGKIAYPNRTSLTNETPLQGVSALDPLEAARAARLERQMQVAKLPRRKHSLSMLHAARTGEGNLKKLVEVLPTLDTSNNQLKRQAQLAVASYKAGLTVSASLVLGGFDTHGNHDASQFPRLEMLLDGVDFLVKEAEAQGVADKLVVAVGSDFGRTPYYNADNGKDHWSITSMLFMGQGIAGNRVVGATDDGHHPLTVNPETLALDPDGIRITPEHIHRSMRVLAGIDTSPVAAAYPISKPALSLFTE